MTAPRRTPPLPPTFDTRRMMLWSIILVGVVGALGYAAWKAGPASFGGFNVQMKVEAEPVTIPLVGEAAGRVGLTVSVTNRTSSIQIVTATAPCKVFRWILMDDVDRFIQAAEADCDDLVMESKMEPGKTMSERFEAQIDPTRLKPGQRYKMVLEYWGQQGVLMLRAVDR